MPKMRPALASTCLALLTFLTSTCTALQALVNSPCAIQCGNDLGGTSAGDIVCPDSSYSETPAGQTFASCITCQLNSTYQDPVTQETDLQWGLYNIRWAMSYCLFGFPNNTNIGNTPCITSTACGPLQPLIELDSLAPNVTEYAHCGNPWGPTPVLKCSQCLSVMSDEFYLSNFLTALNASCVQRPIPGNTISIEGSLFATIPVNITTPKATHAVSSHHSAGLSLGAKVGIAMGALVLILVITGFCIIWNGRCRRRAYLQRVQRESGYDEWKNQSEHRLRDGPVGWNATPNMSALSHSAYFDSPDSQRPLQPWSARPMDSESPVNSFGEKVYFSPYTSNYTSPVSAQDMIPPTGGEWPVEKKTRFQSPIEAAKSYVYPDRKDSVVSRSGKSKETHDYGHIGDQIEMQDVPIALMRHGHGRGDSTTSIALTEEDARRGEAL